MEKDDTGPAEKIIGKGTIATYIGAKVIETDRGILFDCNGDKRTKEAVLRFLKNIGQ